MGSFSDKRGQKRQKGSDPFNGRVECRLKQRELGDAIGVEQVQISEWERGHRALKVEQLV